MPTVGLVAAAAKLAKTAMAACVDGPGSFDARLDVSPAGTVTSKQLTPVTAPPKDSKTEKCILDALTFIKSVG